MLPTPSIPHDFDSSVTWVFQLNWFLACLDLSSGLVSMGFVGCSGPQFWLLILIYDFPFFFFLLIVVGEIESGFWVVFGSGSGEMLIYALNGVLNTLLLVLIF